MSDITRYDLKVLEGRVDPIYDLSRPVTDEEFDRLAREAGYRRLVDIADVDRLIMDAVTKFPAKALRALGLREFDQRAQHERWGGDVGETVWLEAEDE